MRLLNAAILTVTLHQTACITTALHTMAFPDGYDFEHAQDIHDLEASGNSFVFCAQSPRTTRQIKVTGDSSRSYAMSSETLSIFETQKVWETNITDGCQAKGPTGSFENASTLFFSTQSVPMTAITSRPVAPDVPVARIAKLETDENQTRIRATLENGVVLELRRAGPGEFGIYNGTRETPFVPTARGNTQTVPQWKEQTLRQLSGAVGIYFIRPDGNMGLKLFDGVRPAGSQTALIYVPYVSMSPEKNRYYLLPLYPFTVILDVLTVALQIAIWDAEIDTWTRCLK